MRYLLDTDTLSEMMRNPQGAAAEKSFRSGIDQQATSVIVAGELHFGAEAVSSARLRSRGQMIGANDLWIAAHARALGLILVTGNTSEFSRVSDLQIENWIM